MDILSQFMIFATGSLALYLLGSMSPRVRFKGAIIGLIGEPFWFYTLITHGQLMVCLLAIVYAFNFSRIARNNYRAMRLDKHGLGPIS